MATNPSKETMCVWRSGCSAPIQCAAAGHCLSVPKDLTDTQAEVRPSKPKLEDFPHPQGGHSLMSFHNALISWQEDEIERLQNQVRNQHAAYQLMFDKAAELERRLANG